MRAWELMAFWQKSGGAQRREARAKAATTQCAHDASKGDDSLHPIKNDGEEISGRSKNSALTAHSHVPHGQVQSANRHAGHGATSGHANVHRYAPIGQASSKPKDAATLLAGTCTLPPAPAPPPVLPEDEGPATFPLIMRMAMGSHGDPDGLHAADSLHSAGAGIITLIASAAGGPSSRGHGAGAGTQQDIPSAGHSGAACSAGGAPCSLESNGPSHSASMLPSTPALGSTSSMGMFDAGSVGCGPHGGQRLCLAQPAPAFPIAAAINTTPNTTLLGSHLHVLSAESTQCPSPPFPCHATHLPGAIATAATTAAATTTAAAAPSQSNTHHCSRLTVPTTSPHANMQEPGSGGAPIAPPVVMLGESPGAPLQADLWRPPSQLRSGLTTAHTPQPAPLPHQSPHHVPPHPVDGKQQAHPPPAPARLQQALLQGAMAAGVAAAHLRNLAVCGNPPVGANPVAGALHTEAGAMPAWTHGVTVCGYGDEEDGTADALLADPQALEAAQHLPPDFLHLQARLATLSLEGQDVDKNLFLSQLPAPPPACCMVGAYLAAARGVRVVTLTHAGITDEGVAQLCRALAAARHRDLWVLDLRHNLIGDAGAEALSELLSGHCSDVASPGEESSSRSRTLSGPPVPVSPMAMAAGVQAGAAVPPVARVVGLRRHSYASGVVDGAGSVPCMEGLVELVLSNNRIGDGGVYALADAVCARVRAAAVHVRVGHNAASDDALCELASAQQRCARRARAARACSRNGSHNHLPLLRLLGCDGGDGLRKLEGTSEREDRAGCEEGSVGRGAASHLGGIVALSFDEDEFSGEESYKEGLEERDRGGLGADIAGSMLLTKNVGVCTLELGTQPWAALATTAGALQGGSSAHGAGKGGPAPTATTYAPAFTTTTTASNGCRPVPTCLPQDEEVLRLRSLVRLLAEPVLPEEHDVASVVGAAMLASDTLHKGATGEGEAPASAPSISAAQVVRTAFGGVLAAAADDGPATVGPSMLGPAPMGVRSLLGSTALNPDPCALTSLGNALHARGYHTRVVCSGGASGASGSSPASDCLSNLRHRFLTVVLQGGGVTAPESTPSVSYDVVSTFPHSGHVPLTMHHIAPRTNAQDAETATAGYSSGAAPATPPPGWPSPPPVSAAAARMRAMMGPNPSCAAGLGQQPPPSNVPCPDSAAASKLRGWVGGSAQEPGPDSRNHTADAPALLEPPSGPGRPPVGARGCRIIVDPGLRDQFAVGRHATTERYEALAAVLPRVYVGHEDRLPLLVDLLCEEMAAAFKERGVPLPPWRRGNALITMWRPRRAPSVPTSPTLFKGSAPGTLDSITLSSTGNLVLPGGLPPSHAAAAASAMGQAAAAATAEPGSCDLGLGQGSDSGYLHIPAPKPRHVVGFTPRSQLVEMSFRAGHLHLEAIKKQDFVAAGPSLRLDFNRSAAAPSLSTDATLFDVVAGDSKSAQPGGSGQQEPKFSFLVGVGGAGAGGSGPGAQLAAVATSAVAAEVGTPRWHGGGWGVAAAEHGTVAAAPSGGTIAAAGHADSNVGGQEVGVCTRVTWGPGV